MKRETFPPLFEVIAVNRKTHSRRIVSQPTTKEQAESLIRTYVAQHEDTEESFHIVSMDDPFVIVGETKENNE